MTQKNCSKNAGEIIQIDEEGVKDHLGQIVKGTVQDTLNAMLDAEADHLCADFGDVVSNYVNT